MIRPHFSERMRRQIADAGTRHATPLLTDPDPTFRRYRSLQLESEALCVAVARPVARGEESIQVELDIGLIGKDPQIGLCASNPIPRAAHDGRWLIGPCLNSW